MQKNLRSFGIPRKSRQNIITLRLINPETIDVISPYLSSLFLNILPMILNFFIIQKLFHYPKIQRLFEDLPITCSTATRALLSFLLYLFFSSVQEFYSSFYLLGFLIFPPPLATNVLNIHLYADIPFPIISRPTTNFCISVVPSGIVNILASLKYLSKG